MQDILAAISAQFYSPSMPLQHLRPSFSIQFWFFKSKIWFSWHQHWKNRNSKLLKTRITYWSDLWPFSGAWGLVQRMVQERKPLSTTAVHVSSSPRPSTGAHHPVQVRAELRAQGKISQDTAHPKDPKDACPCTMESNPSVSGSSFQALP